jgi:hypothetical protein
MSNKKVIYKTKVFRGAQPKGGLFKKLAPNMTIDKITLFAAIELPQKVFSENCRTAKLCSTQLLVHQRMNADGFLLPNDLFS